MSKHNIFQSFGFAFRGLALALSERNFKLHIISTVLAVGLSFYYNISSLEWVGILLCIGGVMALELINTSLEKLTDMVSPEFDKRAGAVKDISAAAVLCMSIVAAVVGLIIFVPYIIGH